MKKKNGLFIQSYDQLISHNIDSITNRIDTLEKHKLYNHIARIQYLNYIFPNHKVVISDDIKKLLYFLHINEGNMQIYNYRKDGTREFMLSMIGNFLNKLLVDNITNRSFIVTKIVDNKPTYTMIPNIKLLSIYKPFQASLRTK